MKSNYFYYQKYLVINYCNSSAISIDLSLQISFLCDHSYVIYLDYSNIELQIINEVLKVFTILQKLFNQRYKYAIKIPVTYSFTYIYDISQHDHKYLGLRPVILMLVKASLVCYKYYSNCNRILPILSIYMTYTV